MILTAANLTETLNGRRVWLDIIQHPKDTYWHRCNESGVWQQTFETKEGRVHYQYVTFTPDRDDLIALKMNKQVSWKRVLESPEKEGFILRTWQKNPSPIRFTLTKAPRTFLPPTVLAIKTITGTEHTHQDLPEQTVDSRTQTLASVFSRIHNLGSSNVYLRVRMTKLHDYFVLSENQSILSIVGGVSLHDIVNDKIIYFARIKSVSRRFRPLYKIFLMATANDNWVEIAEDMTLLVNQVPRKIHSNVLHIILGK